MNASRDGGEEPSWSKVSGICGINCVAPVSADVDGPIARQPSNANEKTQLISDGSRRYADTYT